MTKNYDGADDEDDQHHGHLLESFSLLPEELGPISLIVSNTINLQKIIFDNDGDGDDDDDDVECDKNTDGDQDDDANDFLYKHALYKFVCSYRLEIAVPWANTDTGTNVVVARCPIHVGNEKRDTHMRENPESTILTVNLSAASVSYKSFKKTHIK